MRSSSRDGQKAKKSGRGRARANPSVSLENTNPKKIADTSGQAGFPSSPSADLQLSLENRLHQNLDVNGSPEYALTWKRWDMLSGPPICALRARAHRTFAKDSTGWPTPTGPAPHDSENTVGKARPRKGYGLDLEQAASLAGWATPAARDYRHANLKPYRERGGGKKGEQLNNQVIHSGPMLRPSPAKTGKPDQLNPAHSRWLMGFPVAWDACADMVTQSSPKPPPNS